MTPQLLYKYFPPERISFFFKPTVRFTPTAEFNDPFEFKPAWNERGTHPQLIKLPSVNHTISDGIASYSGTTDSNIELLDYVKYENDTRIYEDFSIAGVLCLTERCDNLLMWAHYAKSHAGFVIGFDRKNVFFNPKNENQAPIRSLVKIKYQEERPSVSSVGFKMHELFYIKSKDWAYEEEWRLVIGLPRNDEKFKGIENVPCSAIKSIILGVRSCDELKLAAEDFIEDQKLKQNPIDIACMTWDSSTYKLSKRNS